VNRPFEQRQPLAIAEKFVITNPKRTAAAQIGRDQWFPYYAGFSSEFAGNILSSTSLRKGATVLDPWNGSGTTTVSAVRNGYKAIGFDLNPAMAVVAKARLLPDSELAKLLPLLTDILKKSNRSSGVRADGEPLRIWLAPPAATAIRQIERAIHMLLVSPLETQSAIDGVQNISSLAAFFYVALFRTVRSILRRFHASNPTWIVRPSTMRSRIRPSASRVTADFADQVSVMMSDALMMKKRSKYRTMGCTIGVASSERLPLQNGSIDLVLSSPPYCTRIDYGIATSPELGILGFDLEGRLPELRAGLIGTPTIASEVLESQPSWGHACVQLLRKIWNHPSKAARSYYYKTHIQYFSAMAQSLSELGRCLNTNGRCVLVVQDSYFKDLHIDLAGIFAEMALSASLRLHRQVDFPISRTFGSVNSRSRKYRKTSSATESVLCFVRQTSPNV
jgi:DNA modification methylase